VLIFLGKKIKSSKDLIFFDASKYLNVRLEHRDARLKKTNISKLDLSNYEVNYECNFFDLIQKRLSAEHQDEIIKVDGPPDFDWHIFNEAGLKTLVEVLLRAIVMKYLSKKNSNIALINEMTFETLKIDLAIAMLEENQNHENLAKANLLLPLELKWPKYQKKIDSDTYQLVLFEWIKQLLNYMKIRKLPLGILTTVEETYLIKVVWPNEQTCKTVVSVSEKFKKKQFVPVVIYASLCALDNYQIDGQQLAEKSESTDKPTGNFCSESLSQKKESHSYYDAHCDIFTPGITFPETLYHVEVTKPVVILAESSASHAIRGRIGKQVKHNIEWSPVAMKCIDRIKDIERSYGVYELFLNEAKILYYLNMVGVTCVPKLRYAGVYDDIFWVVATEFFDDAEFIEFKDLNEKQREQFDAARLKLHCAGVVHNDLKSDNVLFTSRPDRPCIIIDFGISQLIKQPMFIHSMPTSSKFLEIEDERKEFPHNRSVDDTNANSIASVSTLKENYKL
jgi:hypothetical protein